MADFDVARAEPLAIIDSGLAPNGDEPLFLSQAVVGEDLWFAAPSGLVRVDPRTNKAEVIDTEFGAYMAVIDKAVWRQAYYLNRVSRYDAATGKVDLALDLEGPLGIVATDSALWVTEHNTGMLDEIDPQTGEIEMQTLIAEPGEAGPAGIAQAAGSLWISVPRDQAVLRINPATGNVLDTVVLPFNPGERLTYAAGALWMVAVSDTDEDPAPPGTLMRLDPTSAQVSLIAFPPGPDGGGPTVCEIEGEAWIPSGDSLIQLDRTSGQPTRAVRLGLKGYAATTATEMLGSVWVSSRLSSDLIRVRPSDLRLIH